MELTGLHLLLTYQCNLECDHCFTWGSPWQDGTMTLRDVRQILQQAEELGTVKWVYFEGGEPFLFYAVLLKGILEAASMGFQVGIVSNGYWATDVEDALEWLRPKRLRSLFCLCRVGACHAVCYSGARGASVLSSTVERMLRRARTGESYGIAGLPVSRSMFHVHAGIGAVHRNHDSRYKSKSVTFPRSRRALPEARKQARLECPRDCREVFI